MKDYSESINLLVDWANEVIQTNHLAAHQQQAVANITYLLYRNKEFDKQFRQVFGEAKYHRFIGKGLGSSYAVGHRAYTKSS